MNQFQQLVELLDKYDIKTAQHAKEVRTLTLRDET